VTTTADSGAGSLREAINQINADTSHAVWPGPSNPSVDEIDFAVGTGVATITPQSALPIITNAVVIDGRSEPGFPATPLIELNGTNAGSGANGLNITAGNSTVRGLVINRFGQDGILLSGGGGDLIAGNYIGTDVSGTLNRGNALSGIMILSSGNTVGGTGAWAGNVISGNNGTRNSVAAADGGVGIIGANNNVVEGNLIGTNTAGTAALGNSGYGVVVVGASTRNVIRGADGARNVVSGNSKSGIGIEGGPLGNSVLGNYVGTDIAGTFAIGNGVNGILVQVGSNGNTIGNNVISGNGVLGSGAGVNIINSSNNRVQANFIGTDSTGTTSTGTDGKPLGNVPIGGIGAAVAIQNSTGLTSSGNTIGGTTPGAGNIIAGNLEAGVWFTANGVVNNFVEDNIIRGNTGNGVQLAPFGSNAGGGHNNTITGNVISGNSLNGIMLSNSNTIANRLTGNRIYNNVGLGIDLGGDGVTLNDSAGHVGPNNYQDFPVLAAAEAGASVLVSGTLTNAANTTYTIDVYASPTADPSGYGEGQYYLGATSVTTDASGKASFAADFSAAALPGGVVPAGWAVSATATDPAGNTSEFSADVTAAVADALQSVLTTGGTVTVQTTTPDQAHAIFAAANALDPVTTPASTIVLDLGGQTITATVVNVPPQVTLTIVHGTFHGGSPALVVSSGQVIVNDSTFDNATDAPTIQVTGGSLTLRGCLVQESTGYSDAAIAVSGGTVDLGTASDPGGNTINVNGAGAFAQNTTSSPVAAVGDTFTVNDMPLTPSSLSGVVWEDFNNDGQVDFSESGIPGVTLTLTGTDFLGRAVNLSQTTDAAGAYVFLNLPPGNYSLTETQPAGYLQGLDAVGTAGGGLVATDQFAVALALEVNGLNYNYGELPTATGSVQKGQTAGIGFWNNKHGQDLIKALNGGATSTQLANWLAATLPHLFGVNAGSANLTGKSNDDVAALFLADFVLKGVKLDAQVLATALSVYATSATLDATGVAAAYGFTVSGDGVGTATVNVGSNGDAFGVANNTTMTVLDLLRATDAQAVNGVLYNGDATKRNHANNVYSALNEAGGNG
jgi:hypothetical protein